MSLESLRFESRFTDGLPGDPDERNLPRQVQGALWSNAAPKSAAAPRLVALEPAVAELLGVPTGDSEALAQVFSGSRSLPGMRPYAMCYGGHQFGHWAGQLGDGRAINLGELRGTDGDLWTVQLKGAGPTPYSRTADGLAVLRSSVREFLCSEAMHYLGVPTTRALSLVLTGEQVWRDMFYDGRAAQEPGAVVCRVARSFVRIGSFELPASRGDEALLRRLAEQTVRWHFPGLVPASGEVGPEVYLAWFDELLTRNLDLVTHWMRVGFVHGVLNTDNLSILGETIDYGPYGWLEDFDPNWTPNTTDGEGRRYAFGNQPAVVHWNLTRLASTLVPLVGAVEPLQERINAFPARYAEAHLAMMTRKLGIAQPDPAVDAPLVEELERVLQLAEIDWTLFFRGLARVAAAGTEDADDPLRELLPAFYGTEPPAAAARAGLESWLDRWRERVAAQALTDADRAAAMNAVNPLYVLRNYLAQVAIDRATEGDFEGITELQAALRSPYTEQPGMQHLAEKRPDWARHRPGCSMLSCSS